MRRVRILNVEVCQGKNQKNETIPEKELEIWKNTGKRIRNMESIPEKELEIWRFTWERIRHMEVYLRKN